MFKIIVQPNEFVHEWGETFIKSCIVINDFSEDFLLPISYWCIDDYQKCWKKSINNMVNYNKDKAILLTSMYDLKKTNFIYSWVVYKEEKKVIVQNKILFKENYIEFNIEELMKKIPDREVYSDDGKKISEWIIDYDDILGFYKELCYQNI